MKTIGYLIFAGFFYFFRLFSSIKPKKVFGIMTHDGSIDSNVGSMVDYLSQRGEGYYFHFIKKADRKGIKDLRGWKSIISFFIVKPYHMATSKYILLDNIFLPMAYMKFSEKVLVVQLWHGTGTIKKFGQDVNTGRLKSLEKRANGCVTHLIVNSEETKTQYGEAFGISSDKVFVYGLPRTDIFFNQDKIEERRMKFYHQYPDLKGKKLILYAPTFRDEEQDKPMLALGLAKVHEDLPKDFILLLRLHPFVMEALSKDGLVLPEAENVVSMSSYPDINTLLLVSDYLITDYSSVIFEFCLMEKPMIFYAYDLEEFSDSGRGFYRPYEEYVPGPVVKDTEGVLAYLDEDNFDSGRVKAFVNDNYKYLDGKSAERLYLHIFKKV